LRKLVPMMVPVRIRPAIWGNLRRLHRMGTNSTRDRTTKQIQILSVSGNSC